MSSLGFPRKITVPPTASGNKFLLDQLPSTPINLSVPGAASLGAQQTGPAFGTKSRTLLRQYTWPNYQKGPQWAIPSFLWPKCWALGNPGINNHHHQITTRKTNFVPSSTLNGFPHLIHPLRWVTGLDPLDGWRWTLGRFSTLPNRWSQDLNPGGLILHLPSAKPSSVNSFCVISCCPCARHCAKGSFN